MITVNMAKARDIHRGKLRDARAPLFADLDTQYMRANETADAAAMMAVVAKKQALRDVTKHPDIEAAQTIGDLVKVWPAALGAKP
jgi:hypothetical protein